MIRTSASRFGLLADVHANLQALEAVVRHLDAEGVEEIWCLGDVVGYGGDPEACVAIVRERCAGIVRGNHDAAVADAAFREDFNPHARAAIERQAEILAAETIAWLGSLPPILDLGDVALLHGSAVDPDGFPYVLGPRDAARELGALHARWSFFGHTHLPAAWRRRADGAVEALAFPEEGSLALDRAGSYLVNPGSVGQPRDGNPRAACAVFDRESAVLEIRRLTYDVAAAQAAIRRAGMPAFEAARLAAGR